MPMRVRFSRTGGVAGTRLAAELDTAELPPAEAKRIESLARAALAARGGRKRARPPGPDRFVYRVAIEEAGATVEIEAGEETASGALKELVKHLTELARRRRRGK